MVAGGTRDGYVIVTEQGGSRFDATRGWVDLTEFNRLFESAMVTLDRPVMEQALALVTGELLEDEPNSDWAQRPVQRPNAADQGRLPG